MLTDVQKICDRVQIVWLNLALEVMNPDIDSYILNVSLFSAGNGALKMRLSLTFLFPGHTESIPVTKLKWRIESATVQEKIKLYVSS